MHLTRPVIAVGLLLLSSGLACSRDRKEPPSDQVGSSASAERTAKRPSSDWPIIEVEGDEVRLDGKITGSSRAVSDLGRMQRIDELFTALKERREKWKEENAGKAFPGVCGIRVGGDVSMLVFKSVFQTAAYAGYPFVSVQPIDDADTIVNLNAQIPGPPPPMDAPVEPAPEQRLHVQLLEAEVMLVRKQGAVVISESKLERDPKDLLRAACADWKANGVHKDKTDARLDVAIFHAENRLTMKDALPYIVALGSCTREREGHAGPSGAFDVGFSVR